MNIQLRRVSASEAETLPVIAIWEGSPFPLLGGIPHIGRPTFCVLEVDGQPVQIVGELDDSWDEHQRTTRHGNQFIDEAP